MNTWNLELPSVVHRLLHLWYAMTAPNELPETAPLWQREVVRRARIVSLVVLVTIWLAFFPLLFHPSWQIVIGLVIAIVLDLFALVAFNRRGKIRISGLIITAVTDLGLMVQLSIQLFLYRELHLGFVPFLALLVQGVAVAASTLDIATAFFVFLLNGAFLFAVIRFVPYSPDLLSYLKTSEGLTGLVETPFSCLQVTFFVIAIWVTSTNHALQRADTVDARASMMVTLASQQQRDIQEVLHALALATSDPSMQLQVTVSANNSLFPLVEGYNRTNQEKRRSQEAISRLLALLKTGGSLQQWELTGTEVDRLVALLLHTDATAHDGNVLLITQEEQS